MRPVLSALAAALLVGLSACSSASAPDDQGTVHLSFQVRESVAFAGGVAPLCAQLTLQAYVPAADGTPAQSGAPVTVISAGGADADSEAGVTLDCTAGALDSNGYNWGYIVTATDFSACGGDAGTLGAAATGVSPSVVTINAPVACVAGKQVEVPVQLEVSQSQPNEAGYLDIFAQVTVMNADAGSAPVCAQFTLQPYSLDVSGNQTDSGAPVVFSTADDTGLTQLGILGCVDGPSDSPGFNWGFAVTATNFSTCPTDPTQQGQLGTPLTNITPSTVTFDVPVSCAAGLDTPVNVNAQVTQSP